MKKVIDQRLIDYIKQQLQKNISSLEIEKTLVGVGWNKSDVDEALKSVINPSSAPLPVSVSQTEGSFSFLGIFELLKKSWQIYKERFWKFIGILLTQLFLGVIVFVLITVIFLLGSSLIRINQGISTTNSFQTFLLARLSPMGFPLIVVTIIFLLGILVIQIWSQVALLTEAVSEAKLGIREAYHKSRGKIFQLFWLSIISGLIISGGTILLVIPGIILSTWFSLSMFVLVAENIGGVSALVRSREYIRGHFWGVLGRVLFLGLPVIIFSPISNLITSFFKEIKLPFIGSVLSLILSLSLVFLITPLIIISLATMYRNLKALKGEVVFAKKSKVAFSLIGILGVLAILVPLFSLAILSSINPLKQMSKAQDVVRKSELEQIGFALERYYKNNSQCPLTLEELVAQGELKEVPRDPKTKLPYRYERLTGSNSCRVCVTLEVGGLTCFDVPTTSSGGVLPVSPSPTIY